MRRLWDFFRQPVSIERKKNRIIQGLYEPHNTDGKFWFLKVKVDLAKFRERKI